MKLLLARHGETDWNVRGIMQGQSDTSLNANGRAQAKELGRLLLERGTPVTALYTSPQKRARETAEIAGGLLGLTPVPVEALREISFGKWEGHNWAEIEAGWPELYASYLADRLAVCPPEGESYAALLARVVPALEAIAASGRGTALVVAHSAVIKSLLCRRDGVSFAEINRRYALNNASLVDFGEELPAPGRGEEGGGGATASGPAGG